MVTIVTTETVISTKWRLIASEELDNNAVLSRSKPISKAKIVVKSQLDFYI
jgi:hypothetical protein